VRYLPGWTVQCINPGCQARGHWLRADNAPEEHCSNCGEPLHNVPPPLGPQLRLRPRPLTTYRPNRRARWAYCVSRRSSGLAPRHWFREL